MADAISIQELIDARTDAKTLEEAVNGDAVTTVLSRLGETYPTLSNALNQIDGQISDANDMLVESVTTLFTNGGLPATPFATKALMTASALVDGDYAQVTDDTVNNGLYVKTAGAWVKSEYDPLAQAKTYADTNKADTLLRVQNVFATKALMTESALVDGSNAQVNNDTTADNNGFYKKTAGTWVETTYDPVSVAKSYTDEVNTFNIKGTVGKNLYDKSKGIAGKNLNDDGGLSDYAERSVSDYIPVKPSKAYSFTSIRKAVFYNKNKEFLQLAAGSPEGVISHSDAAFLRITFDTGNTDKVQVEQSDTRTSYSEFELLLPRNSVDSDSVSDGAITAGKIAPFSVRTENLSDVVFDNLYDINTMLIKNKIILNDGVTIIDFDTADITKHIPVKPNTQYATKDGVVAHFYDKSKGFISSTQDEFFTTPESCYFARFRLSTNGGFRFHINEGDTLPDVTPQPHTYTLKGLRTPQPTARYMYDNLARKYNLSDAWFAWRSGGKFPICFLGDSTTNGNGTTGLVHRLPTDSYGKDFVAPNSYSKLLQDYIRDATGNSIMRVYNAGFSGRNSGWALSNIDTILGEDYADTKMLGISHGINDKTASVARYVEVFYERIEGLINWCFDRGIQPFLLTTQPVTMPSIDGDASGPEINEIANSIKKNLADKYNLELIDVNKFAQVFMQYSTKPLLNNIMEGGGNTIHFGDGGHRFTADLLFASFSQNVVWTDGSVQLDYSTQSLRSDMRYQEMVQLAEFKHGFKLESTGTHSNSDDKLYQEFWLFNHGKKALELKAYFANQVNGQYVVVNGERTTMTSQGQVVAVLDIGLHKIQAFSGATSQLDWLGFKATAME